MAKQALEHKFCHSCGVNIPSGVFFCSNCGTNIRQQQTDDSVRENVVVDVQSNGKNTLKRLADYEKISGIFWIVLGAIQIITIIGIIAGAWNIYAGYSRIKISPRILSADSDIPEIFDDMTQLVIIGLINLILGGIIGLLFVAVDFIIRDKVLENKSLFNRNIKEQLMYNQNTSSAIIK